MRKVIMLSDLHVGSRVALAPPKYLSKSKHTISFSPFQKTLYAYWQDFAKFADPGARDILLLCGDTCDGNNIKEKGRQTTTAELEEQMEMALQLLEPYRVCTVIGCDGSAYHKGSEVSLDRLVVERMGGTWFGAIGFVEVTPTGKKLMFRHGSGCPINRARKQEKESREIDEAIGKGKVPHDVDLIVRGHEHEWRCLELEHRTHVVLPGWKGCFPYKNAEGYGRYLGNPGGAIAWCRKDEPVLIQKKLYPYVHCYDKLEAV